MMKNLYRICSFFTIIIFYPCLVKSQQGTINYKLSTYDKKNNDSRITNLIIYFNKSNSVEFVVKPSKVIKDNEINEFNQIRVITSAKPYFVYKDFAKKELFLPDYLMSKRLLISDTLNNFKWKITSEKTKIQNFNCKKATVSFRGRFYEAWYTEDIPLRNGPWKFCGLPGLIVKVKDNSSNYIYDLVGINLKAKFDNSIVSMPKNYFNDRVITYKEFRNMYNQKLEDNIKLSRVGITTPDGVSGTVIITLPEKQEKF